MQVKFYGVLSLGNSNPGSHQVKNQFNGIGLITEGGIDVQLQALHRCSGHGIMGHHITDQVFCCFKFQWIRVFFPVIIQYFLKFTPVVSA